MSTEAEIGTERWTEWQWEELLTPRPNDARVVVVTTPPLLPGWAAVTPPATHTSFDDE